jgi:hypothetical protein
MFFGWMLVDMTAHLLATDAVTAHLLAMDAMDVTTVEATGSNLAPSHPAVTTVALVPRLLTILVGVSSALIKMDASGIQTSSVTPVTGSATALPNVTCSPSPSSSISTRRRSPLK